MLSCVPPTSVTPIVLDGASLEVVDSFRYLGSLITETGQGVDEVVSRINHARFAFYPLCAPLWNRRELSLSTKSRVYQAVFRSILLYGGEIWPMRVEDMKRLEVFDNDWLRRILRHRRVN
ncbi:unnamed protein product [Dibothriocephalus latus]|uniref:Uncharacterized protein n=1 Tax=Dibothriocephalus latus TaxID=60516 RepID=A0A3P7P006_DIBLA|nr:unnamed protein product [Dibothriocephalus latus]